MKKRVFLALFSVAFLMTGCGFSGNSSLDSSAQTAGRTGAEEKSYDFVFVCPIIDNEYWEACIAGIEKADEELGIVTRIVGPHDAASFTTEIIGYMEEAVNSNPDGIMAYAGIEGMFPLINQAGEKGIPFLAIDSDAPDTSRVAYVGTDSYNSGYQAGETMVKLTEGKAKIGVLVSSLSAEKETTVVNAFQDAIADYPMEIVAIEETDADPAVAAVKTRTMLEEHPEITAMFNTAGYNVTGAARVKKELALDDLILVGFDDVEENLAFVREGVIDAILVQSPEQMGYQGVYLLKECVDNGGLQKNNYDTGTILVTQENVDSYKD